MAKGCFAIVITLRCTTGRRGRVEDAVMDYGHGIDADFYGYLRLGREAEYAESSS